MVRVYCYGVLEQLNLEPLLAQQRWMSNVSAQTLRVGPGRWLLQPHERAGGLLVSVLTGVRPPRPAILLHYHTETSAHDYMYMEADEKRTTTRLCAEDLWRGPTAITGAAQTVQRGQWYAVATYEVRTPENTAQHAT
jgi:hypothetical protein